jgi:hypothetical protein
MLPDIKTERIAARNNGSPGWCAYPRGGIKIPELNALRCQRIKVWSFNFGTSETTKVPVTQVIGEKEKYIGFICPGTVLRIRAFTG